MGAITFPNLGIEINPDQIAIKAESMKKILGFGKDIYWYGIIIAVGFLLAVVYGLRRAKDFGLNDDNILDMLFVAVPTAIICARLYYCIFEWKHFSHDPISVLYIWEGGLAIYGGVIGAVVSVLIFSKIKKMPFGIYGDVGGLGLLIGQMIGRWGNFINREAHGSVTNSFFKMGLETIDGVVYYHPTFLYESVWNLVGFIALHFYSKRRKFDGEIFLLYIAWYGLGRSWIEGLRTDSLYFFGTGIRTSQLLAILSLVAALVVLVYMYVVKKPRLEDMYVNRKAAADIEQLDNNTAESKAAEQETED